MTGRCAIIAPMSARTIFISAASDDLERLRNALHGAFSRAHFRVFTQGQSLGVATGTLREFLTEHISKSDYIFHLAGEAYGSDADEPFPGVPGFQCSWTQFEYYHAHESGKKVFAFVCEGGLVPAGFVENGADAGDIERRRRLQHEHRLRVETGAFNGTPLEGKARRALNQKIGSMEEFIGAVAAAVAEMKEATEAGEEIAVRPEMHTVPPPKLGFVGRGQDIEKLRTLDPSAGAVLTGLRGMGGIGKTELALVLAREWTPHFPDAQVFLEGCGTQAHPPSAADLLAQVIRVFRPKAELPAELARLRGIYHEVLDGRKVLLLLDNALNTAQAAPLIPPAGCGLIVTSRQTILLGTVKPHSVGMLPDSEAATLLREYHSALTDAETAALVRRCAGMPLALRLAGSHLAMDAAERGGTPNVTSYLSALDWNRQKAFDSVAAELGEESVSATLRLSEERLADADRDAWRRLGVFAASFDARAAEAVAGADEMMLGRFVSRSMLDREGVERYKLHDLAADYARARLAEHAGDALTALHLAHARHCVRIATEAEAAYNEGGEALLRGLALFDRERAHMENAFAWLRTRHDDEPARMLIALAGVMPWASVMRFHPQIRVVWQEARLNAARALSDPGEECGALSDLGIAWRHLGEAEKAAECHEAQLALARSIGDPYWVCNALNNLGNCHHDLGDMAKANACYSEAYPIALELPPKHRRWVAYCLNHLRHTVSISKAIDHHAQALAIVREIRDLRGEANTLGNLSMAHRELGNVDRAIEYAQEQQAVAAAIGDLRAECNALGNLSRVLIDSGRAAEALDHLSRMIDLSREAGYQRGEAHALFHSAIALDSLGRRAEARASAEKALAIYNAVKDPRAVAARKKLAEWQREC